MRIETNGIHLEVELAGPENGPPLVLVMGIGAQLVHWPKPFVQLLVDQGYRVIRFDNRDIGKSQRMDHLGVPKIGPAFARAALGLKVNTPYTLWDMADDTASLIRTLGYDSAHIMGISMGGMIAQCTAIAHPTRIRSLTSMASTTGGRYLGKPEALMALFGPAPRNRSEAIERGIEVFRTIGSPGFHRDEDMSREIFGSAWDRGYNPRGFIRQFGAILENGDREPLLRKLNMPTLVIHGAQDPLVPPEAGQATAHAIPGAQMQLIEGLGHDLPNGAWPLLADMIGGHASYYN
jgi:pimeloyl-ACP methyl ester carboxylesterase